VKRLRWKLVVIAGTLSSFASMLLALAIVRALSMTGALSTGGGFQSEFLAMLLLVALTPIFSSLASFGIVYAVAWEARAVNAWLSVVVSLVVDVVVGFPILLLSAIAAS